MAGLFDQSPPQGLFGALPQGLFGALPQMIFNPAGYWGGEAARLLTPPVQGMAQGVVDLGRVAEKAMSNPTMLGMYPEGSQPDFYASGARPGYETGAMDPTAMVPYGVEVAKEMMGGGAIFPAPANSLNMGIRAYHGSPHDFERFDLGKIGTGEGAQAYGHGLYFAENPGVAKSYQESLAAQNARNGLGRIEEAAAKMVYEQGSVDAAHKAIDLEIERWKDNPGTVEHLRAVKEFIREPNPGKMYEVDIDASPDEFLDWDKPLSEQPPKVRDVLEAAGVPITQKQYPPDPMFGSADLLPPTGAEAYQRMSAGDQAKATEALRAAGIKGIRYKDAGSRGTEAGTSNYVVFSDDIISILKKYGLAGLMAGGAGAAMLGGSTDQASASPFGYRTGGRF